ncbi:substrate-binding periplasmic protein [Dongia sp.]|uniref:substrate-binding periplasmic protein n=1 Tax=Dongia sp. TaxID=1977262 RepID=UPI0035ADBB98
MKRRHFLLGGTSVFLALSRRAGAQDKRLRIAYPDKSPPNSWLDSLGGVSGLTVDLMAEVAAAAGLAFLPVARPLPRVQLEVETGLADGMCLAVTPARRLYAQAASEPLVSGPVTMFVRRDNPALKRLETVRSLDDLAKADVTVIAIAGNGWIKENIESRGIRTEHASGTTGTVRMLLGGRGDVIVDMSSQINWILKAQAEASNVIELPTVMANVDWHLQISKKSPVIEDLPKLSAAIKELKASPLYEATLRKYGMKA